MTEFYNASHQDFADVMSGARHKFLIRFATWTDSESKMRWVLEQAMAKPAERKAARDWIRSHGVTR